MLFWTTALLATILSVVTHHAACSVIPIVDDAGAFPFLRDASDPQNLLKWDSGTLLQLLGRCLLIRVTRRGVRCIGTRDTLLKGWEQKFTTTVTNACVPQSNALCEMENGIRFFPTTDSVFVSELSVGKCRHGQGRVLVAENFTIGGKLLDDISLCDVLDNNLDVIFDPVNSKVFTKQLGSGSWLYIITSLLIFVVVVLTAETMSNHTHSSLFHNLTAWTLLVLISLLMFTNADTSHPIVTVQDVVFMAVSMGYIGISTIYWISAVVMSADVMNHVVDDTVEHLDEESDIVEETAPATQAFGLNAMIAAIHFTTCVLYGTVDNAYVTGFFFVFLFRNLQKLHDAHRNPTKWSLYSSTILILDISYTVSIFFFGVLAHYTDDTEAVFYTAAQFVICEALASNRGRKRNPVQTENDGSC